METATSFTFTAHVFKFFELSFPLRSSATVPGYVISHFDKISVRSNGGEKYDI